MSIQKRDLKEPSPVLRKQTEINHMAGRVNKNRSPRDHEKRFASLLLGCCMGLYKA